MIPLAVLMTDPLSPILSLQVPPPSAGRSPPPGSVAPVGVEGVGLAGLGIANTPTAGTALQNY